ncbi:MAG: urease accessory protein UreE [Nitrosomonas sp.]|nr:urease accessory protein UreE [Nitrosomonas sp.]
MIILNAKIPQAEMIYAQLILPYELRENSRLRTTLASGEEVAIFMERGTVLRNNDLLKSDDEKVIQIIAANEPTYRITCDSTHSLLRCAFHLGNRHTQTQVGDGYLRIFQDSVLKEMLKGLGATVIEESAQFEPESGAYGGDGHHHGKEGHDHSHGQLAPIPARQKIHRATDVNK